MFQLHDRTRRRLCVAAFACVAAIPSLLVGGWCAARHLPSHAQAEADALGRQLGLTVKLAGVKHLRPGAVLYEGIELADPETGQTIFRSRCLEVAWQRPTLLLIASQPEVETARIDLVWRWAQRLLESQPGRGEANWKFSAGEVTLRAGDRSQTLTEVAALMEIRPDKTQAQLDFQLAGQSAHEPATVRIVRNRESSPTTSIELSTDDNALPCSLLAMVIGELKPLGERCRFRGRIWADETPAGWDANVAGHLLELDLDSLVSDRFSHRLSGIGEATILSAHFCRGRLDECNGVLVAKGGHVSRSLLKAAGECLELVPGDSPNLRLAGDCPNFRVSENGTVPFNAVNARAADRIAYRELAMSFALDASGLRLHGLCTTAEPGTILSDGRNRILGEPVRESLPLAALVQTLVPPSALQVPASRQSEWLLHLLPISDVPSLPGNEPFLPTARRLRLNDPKPR
jgi:hypothetical protein